VRNWKQRLYGEYVTSGQNSVDIEGGINTYNPYVEMIIKKHLPGDKSISIVDLACGNGGLIDSLKKNGFNNVMGVDISQEQIDIAHKLGIYDVKCQDIDGFFKEQKGHSFDVIFLMDILEHIEKHEVLDMLDKVKILLKDNGMVVIHVPNAVGIFGMSVRYGDFTHESAFTSRSIKQVLSVCGFDKIKCYEDRPIIHSLNSFIRFILWSILSLPFRLLLLAETGVIKHLLSQNILVIAKFSD
jgi:SAM-dependent methyltransferase